MIAIYNRYVGNVPGRYARRVTYPSSAGRKQEKNDLKRSPPQEEEHSPPCPAGPGSQDSSLTSLTAGIGKLFKSFLPDWLDVSDLVLLLLMLFLYIESEDEDFLIILLVVGFGVFKKP